MASACAGETDDGDTILLGEAGQALAVKSSALWVPVAPTRKVYIPVCFKNGTSAQRTATQSAVENSWEAIDDAINQSYGVDFTGWATCPTDPKGKFISVSFVSSIPGGWGGYVYATGPAGLQKNPTMELVDTYNIVIRHEFGHVLGFEHEFSRFDYDDVDPNCTYSAGDPDLALSEVDTRSIMNYQDCGQGALLTESDKLGFRRVYGPFGLNYAGSGVATQAVNLRLATSQTLTATQSMSLSLNAGTPVLAQAEFIKVSDPDTLGPIKFGDTVRVVFLTGFLYSAATSTQTAALGQTLNSTSTGTRFVVEGGTTGATVNVNDSMTLRHVNSGRYVYSVNGAPSLVTSSSPKWRLTSMGGGSTL